MEGDLERLRARADAYLDLAQRSQADFANYKRRVEVEREADAARVRVQTVADLLPLIDDLDRAISHLPPDLADHPWATGVAMLAGRLRQTLSRYGLEPIGQPGEPFDPAVHEAVAYEARHGCQPGTVAEVFRSGYRAGDRLIRPAQVVVAREPPPETTPPTAQRPPAPEPGDDEGPGHLIDRRI